MSEQEGQQQEEYTSAEMHRRLSIATGRFNSGMSLLEAEVVADNLVREGVLNRKEMGNETLYYVSDPFTDPTYGDRGLTSRCVLVIERMSNSRAGRGAEAICATFRPFDAEGKKGESVILKPARVR